MGENCVTKPKVSLYSSDKIHFQTYVESVKQRKIPWDIFEKLLEDFIYSDIDRLKYLNEILLNELTKNSSNIDRLRYLNSILLTEFKELVQREDDLQNTENEHFEESEKSMVDLDSNSEIIKKDDESNILRENESNKDSMNDHSNNMESEQINPQNEYFENYERSTVHLEESEISTCIDSDLDNEIIKEEGEIDIVEVMEIMKNNINRNSIENSMDSNQIETQSDYYEESEKSTIDYDTDEEVIKDDTEKEVVDIMQIEMNENLDTVNQKNDVIISNQVEANAKRFLCHICNKEYSINFHLKQHIRRIHEECDLNLHKNHIRQSEVDDMRDIIKLGEGHLKKTDQNDPKEYKCGSCGKSFYQAGHLKAHILRTFT